MVKPFVLNYYSITEKTPIKKSIENNNMEWTQFCDYNINIFGKNELFPNEKVFFKFVWTLIIDFLISKLKSTKWDWLINVVLFWFL